MAVKYPLEDLLRVRIIRTDRARLELQKAIERLAWLNEELKKFQKSLEDYRIWRAEEEVRRYAAIMKKVVAKEVLDTLRYDLSQLRDEELRKEKQVEDAKIAVEQGEKAVELARQAQREAFKSQQKIEEHKIIWTQEEQKRQEYLLDIAMEDVRLRSQDEESTREDYQDREEYEANNHLEEV